MKRLVIILLCTVFLLGCGGGSGKPPKDEVKTTTKDEVVMICGSKNAYAYHSHECKGLSRSKSEIKKMSVSEAKNQGYKACGFCYGK
jgi:hypothetical protein